MGVFFFSFVVSISVFLLSSARPRTQPIGTTRPQPGGLGSPSRDLSLQRRSSQQPRGVLGGSPTFRHHPLKTPTAMAAGAGSSGGGAFGAGPFRSSSTSPSKLQPPPALRPPHHTVGAGASVTAAAADPRGGGGGGGIRSGGLQQAPTTAAQPQEGGGGGGGAAASLAAGAGGWRRFGEDDGDQFRSAPRRILPAQQLGSQGSPKRTCVYA